MSFPNGMQQYFHNIYSQSTPSVFLTHTSQENQLELLTHTSQENQLELRNQRISRQIQQQSQENQRRMEALQQGSKVLEQQTKALEQRLESLQQRVEAFEKDDQKSSAPAAKSTVQVEEQQKEIKIRQKGSKTEVIDKGGNRNYIFRYSFDRLHRPLTKPFVDLVINHIRHPNIILAISGVKDVHTGVFTIEVDYLNGGVLSNYTNSFSCEAGKENELPSSKMKFLSSVTKQIAGALHFLNKGKKRSHGNVTSATIFFRMDGYVKLGLPGLLLPEVVKANPLHFVETPFCAPELRLFIQNEIASKQKVDEKTWKEKYNEKSDVWALGAVICSQFLGKKMLPEWGEIDVFATNSNVFRPSSFIFAPNSAAFALNSDVSTSEIDSNSNSIIYLGSPTDQDLEKLREDYQIFNALVLGDGSLNTDLWAKYIPDTALRALAQGCLQVDPEKRWDLEKIVGFIHVVGGLLPQDQGGQTNEHSNLWANDYDLLTKKIKFDVRKLSENEIEMLKDHKIANTHLAKLLKRACELYPDQKTRTLELISGSNEELNGIALEIGKLLTEESEWIEKIYQESREQNKKTLLDQCTYDALKTRVVPINLTTMAKLIADAQKEISSTQNAKRTFLSDQICFPQRPIEISPLLKNYVDEIGEQILNARQDISVEILDKIKQKALKHFSSSILHNLNYLSDNSKKEVRNLMFGSLRDWLGGISSDDEEDNEPIRTIEQALSVNEQRAQRDLNIRKKEPLNQRRQNSPPGMSKPIMKDGVGIVHAQGERDSMEDEHLVERFYLNKANVELEIPIFAVLDGHSGNQAARYAKNYLFNYLNHHLKQEDEPFNALKLAPVDLENGFFKTYPQDTSGTTAAIVIKLDKEIYVVNTGDSRVLIISDKKGYIQATEDADPMQTKYKKDVEKRGGSVFANKRVDGNLSLARSIGDSPHPSITARPTITRYNLEEIGNSVFIICCDGIFERLSSKDVLDEAKRLLDEGMSLEDAASALVKMAYGAGSNDNLSVLIRRFLATCAIKS